VSSDSRGLDEPGQAGSGVIRSKATVAAGANATHSHRCHAQNCATEGLQHVTVALECTNIGGAAQKIGLTPHFGAALKRLFPSHLQMADFFHPLAGSDWPFLNGKRPALS
jgi:hypothetical protein